MSAPALSMNRRPASADFCVTRPLLTLAMSLTRGALALAAALTLTSAAQAAPTISLTAPGDGWSYNTPAALTLKASAAIDPADTGATLVRVEFYADGQLIGSDATGAYSLPWNTAPVGNHVLTAKAIDSLGQETLSAPRSLVITDSTSNLAPTVSLSAPANNAKYALPADITLTASAADVEKNGSITQVEFLANGQVIGTTSTKPYSLTWSNPAAGSYTLSARATDSLGAVTDSAARTITVQSNTPPTVTLGGPTAGTYVLPATLNLTASAAGGEVNTPITQVEFLANGQVIASLNAPPYTFTWANPAPGAYSVAARATDSQGLVTTSTPRAYTLNATNTPPTVSLTAPANNAKYASPAEIVMSASATDLEKNGGITQVEFLANGQVIGSRTATPFSITWSNPPAGTYTLVARATDNMGAVTDSAPRTVTIQNNTPPTVTLGGSTAGTYLLPATLNLTASAAGGEVNTPITQVEFLANDQVIASLSAPPWTFVWANPSAGAYTVAARATDSQGLITTSAPRAYTLNATNTPPTVSLTAPANNSTYVLPADLVVSASAADVEKNGGITQVEFLANGQVIGTRTATPYSIVWSNPAAGSYTLTARATDSGGAQTVSAIRTVTISDVNASPRVSLSAPANHAVFVAPASITLTASASGPEANTPIAQVEFIIDGQVLATLTAKPYTTLWANAPLGSHTLTVRATDSLGGVTTSAARTITVNANQGPVVTLTSPTANQVLPAPATITLSANASDIDGSIAKVEFYNGATLIGTATTAPYTATWSNVPSGAYSLTTVATDNLGGQITSAPVAITVDAPPTVTLTSPSAGSVGIAPAGFTLTANAADSDGTIAKVEFFNGATLIGTATTAPYSLAWDNVAAGNYSLTATATDNLGSQTTSAPINVSVIANSAPAITLTSPTPNQSFMAPASVTLTATASDPDNNLAKVEFWQNGNLIATVLTPPYTAIWSNVTPGSYQITAIATDAIGAQTTSAPTSITVTAAQASLYFIHPDHLGTPRLVTDEQSNIVWRYLPTTEPFGNTPPEEDPSATGNRFEMNLAFPGQYRDRESGLSYNFFRDYDPFGGRYRQSDPIGLAGGINTYSYVNGNPVSYRDLLGLWSTDAHNYFIDSYFAGALPAGALDAIKAGSKFADTGRSWSGEFQMPAYAHMHAQRSSNESASQARANGCAFFQRHMRAYRLNMENGRTRDAYFALGMALHTVMDSTSPVHGWDTTFDLPFDALFHGDGPFSGEDIEMAKRPYYSAITNTAIKKAMQGAPDFCSCTK